MKKKKVRKKRMLEDAKCKRTKRKGRERRMERKGKKKKQWREAWNVKGKDRVRFATVGEVSLAV